MSAGMMLSSFGAFNDDMEEVVAVEREEKGATDGNGKFECGLFILYPFLWGVTRDPEFPNVNVPGQAVILMLCLLYVEVIFTRRLCQA